MSESVRNVRAVRRQLPAQLEVVVDLAVVDDLDAARRAHRLGGCIGQIDDRQTPMRQADPLVANHHAGAIGSPMGQQLRHGAQNRFVRVRLDDAGYSTHLGRDRIADSPGISLAQEGLEVALDLPAGDLLAVLVPLLASWPR